MGKFQRSRKPPSTSWICSSMMEPFPSNWQTCEVAPIPVISKIRVFFSFGPCQKFANRFIGVVEKLIVAQDDKLQPYVSLVLMFFSYYVLHVFNVGRLSFSHRWKCAISSCLWSFGIKICNLPLDSSSFFFWKSPH